MMKTLARMCCFSAALFFTSLSAQEIIDLFDGKSLAGWQAKDHSTIWSVHDGCLVGENDAQKSGSSLWTKASFTDFVFETEFSFSGNIDSGIFLRHENEQIQIGTSRSLHRDMTGSPYIANKKGYPVEAVGAALLLKKNDWNHLRIEARGRKYLVALNGKQVLDYTTDLDQPSGPIGLQVHPGVAMKIIFRALKITPIHR
jgi:hypothetical protein